MHAMIAFMLAAALTTLVCPPPHPHSTAADSGILGTVVLWPTAPVERIGHPAERPVAATVQVWTSAGKLITTVRSDVNGSFCAKLAPGVYTVRALPLRRGVVFPRAVTETVSVRPHAFATVKIRYDTGIR